MDLLEKFDKCFGLIQLVNRANGLFERFEGVFLFGSVLKPSSTFNDIDILLIYNEFDMVLIHEIARAKIELEKRLSVDLDITALSKNELLETKFLSAVGVYCQIK